MRPARRDEQTGREQEEVRSRRAKSEQAQSNDQHPYLHSLSLSVSLHLSPSLLSPSDSKSLFSPLTRVARVEDGVLRVPRSLVGVLHAEGLDLKPNDARQVGLNVLRAGERGEREHENIRASAECACGQCWLNPSSSSESLLRHRERARLVVEDGEAEVVVEEVLDCGLALRGRCEIERRGEGQRGGRKRTGVIWACQASASR